MQIASNCMMGFLAYNSFVTLEGIKWQARTS